MIESLHIEGFKSIHDAQLPLAPLSVLIGPNASGKSNAIEALQLLSWLAEGRRLDDLLQQLRDQELELRGKPSEFAEDPQGVVTLGCRIARQGTSPSLNYSVSLDLSTKEPRLVRERLEAPELGRTVPLYEVLPHAGHAQHTLRIAYDNFREGGSKPQIDCSNRRSIFTQLLSPAPFAQDQAQARREIPEACERLKAALDQILFLNPSPRRMRGYSYQDETKLKGDGFNLSAVLYHVCKIQERKHELLDFVRKLPESDIVDIGFLETPRNEVMLELTESFGTQRTFAAPLLSDGTLRVLVVAGALLSVPEGSLVVIEEIDNGIHPSRATMLLQRISEVSKARNLRVLLTTHNPALLDAIPPRAIHDVLAAFRDPRAGHSNIVRLGDLAEYPDLVARGTIGHLVTKQRLDRFLKTPRTDLDRQAVASEWLRTTEAHNAP